MSSQLSEIEEHILNRFADAWHGPTPPCIEDYLQPVEPGRRRVLLIELVSLDLEHRLLRESVSLRDYLCRFPELSGDPSAVVDLILHEWTLRLQREPNLSALDYVERFPEYRTQLQARLAAPETWSAPPLPLDSTPSNAATPSLGVPMRPLK